jgi:hypothetical protein
MISAMPAASSEREQRHARDHAPGHHEFATMDLLGEGGGDDADRQRQHHHAPRPW